MNTLYPIFLKSSNINLLIVGGGKVAHEKLQFILKSSPDINITIVALEFSKDVRRIIHCKHYKIKAESKQFESSDLYSKNLVIAATNNEKINAEIAESAKEMNILINIADKPSLCDFYMGSIVSKGNLKIGISTNGKSPSFAKRFREVLEDVLPNSTSDLIKNLNIIRKELKSDFSQKVDKLNEITSSLLKTR